MRNPLRTMALAIALVSMPACAAMEIPKFENPLSVARTADQKAYALLASYAAVLEEATDLVRDPLVPTPVKQALVRAERVATPAAETLRIALVGYLHARADYEAIAKDRPTHERDRVGKGRVFLLVPRRRSDGQRLLRRPLMGQERDQRIQAQQDRGCAGNRLI